MEIIEEKQNEINIFKIKGRLDSRTSPEFEEKIAVASKNGAQKMIFDFVDLEYISSAGLRVVLKAAKDMKRIDGAVVLCSMQDYVRESIRDRRVRFVPAHRAVIRGRVG